MSSVQIDKVLNLYKRVFLIPSLTSARISPAKNNVIRVSCVQSQRVLESRSKVKLASEFAFNADLQHLFESRVINASSELLTTYSEDEKLKAVLEDIPNNGKSKQFIKIFNESRILKTYDLSAFDVHGDVYVEPTLCAFHFSPDNKKLLYVAEKKLPKTEPFYKQKPKPTKPKGEDEEEPSRGTEYVYKPDWGEQLVGKHCSVVVILNIEEDTVTPLKTIPDDYFPSQVLWAPNGEDIIGVAHKLKKQRLGLYACTNREACIFQLKGSEFHRITAEGFYSAAPRISPDKKNLIWIEREVKPAHHNVHRLMRLKLDSNETPDVVIDLVKTHVTIANNVKFYGLYNSSLPKRCWSEDSKYIFVNTPQRSIIKSYIINLESKQITEIENNDDTSLIITDVKLNVVAFHKMSLIQPSKLVIGKFDSALSNNGKFKFVEVLNSDDSLDKDNLMFEHNDYVYNNDEPVREFNFTYFGKKSGLAQSVPLIAVAHGGPSSSYSNLFYETYGLFTLLGFGVVFINYRGSTGMGGDNVDYLLGRVGDVDIRDCITAIDATLQKYPWLDPKRVSVYGGSHGGFIGAHLTGQYPDKFKAAVLLNPVIDISAMFSVTDIPDWCCAQSDLSFLGKFPDDENDYSKALEKMMKHSPIAHVNKVKTPTLLALGTKDLRVPMSQGKLWYHNLLVNNVETKLFVYEDNHSLRKDEVEPDDVINSSLWLLEHNNIFLEENKDL